MKLFLRLSLLLFLNAAAQAQSLDWGNDITVYGTSANESLPAITALPGGDTLRAFCVQDGYTAANRVSLTNGLVWESFNTLSASTDSQFIAATSSGNISHAIVYPRIGAAPLLYSFHETNIAWGTPCFIPVSLSSIVADIALISDWIFAPDEPYLSIFWIETDQASANLFFCQSLDGGVSLTPPEFIGQNNANDLDPVRASVAVSWNDEEETIWIAYSTDRAGSVGNQIHLQSSSNQGENWSEPTNLDSVSYPQIEPSLAGYAQTILLAYSRRTGTTTQKDIFFSFSLDNGEAFSETTPITGGAMDEFHPQIIISPDGISFAIFYLAAQPLEEEATVWVRTGFTATPWNLSEAEQVSNENGALRGGAISAAATENGFAVVWSSMHSLGDADILFDASWRGVPVENVPPAMIRQSLLLPAYPNPFNNNTILPIILQREGDVHLIVHDILGRTVAHAVHNKLNAGSHNIALSFSGIPSGSYWVTSPAMPGQIVQITLIK